jgi:hypothetical protein
MPIARKAQSINNVAKKKDPAKVSVQSVREPSLINEMSDTSFGTLDASKDGLLMSYDSATDKFVLVTADELLLSSVDDDDLPDDFIARLEEELIIPVTELDAGGF